MNTAATDYNTLAIRAQNGDTAAMTRILEDFEYRVRSVARKAARTAPAGVDVDDLAQEGRAAILKAVREYSSNDEFSFAARVTNEIKWRIRGAVRANSMLRTSYLVKIWRTARDDESLSVDEIAEAAGCTVETARYALIAGNFAKSFDEAAGDGDGDLYDVFLFSAGPRRPTEQAALDAIEAEERAVAVLAAFDDLSERHRVLVIRHYINGEPARAICADTGDTGNAIRCALQRARRELREALAEWRNDAAIAYRGVQPVKDRWMARITVNGDLRYLGSYRTARQAALAYDAAALEYFGDQAVLNFPVSKNLESERKERVPA